MEITKGDTGTWAEQQGKRYDENSHEGIEYTDVDMSQYLYQYLIHPYVAVCRPLLSPAHA